jgi:hypothetical protein
MVPVWEVDRNFGEQKIRGKLGMCRDASGVADASAFVTGSGWLSAVRE